jgi:hypothetical protein
MFQLPASPWSLNTPTTDCGAHNPIQVLRKNLELASSQSRPGFIATGFGASPVGVRVGIAADRRGGS